MISREEAVRKLSTTAVMVLRGSTKEFEEAIELAIEALSQPERPKGRYIADSKYRGVLGNCSLCNGDMTMLHNYCPNCGADCRGEEE